MKEKMKKILKLHFARERQSGFSIMFFALHPFSKSMAKNHWPLKKAQML
jgi:hypothetical protein